MGTTVLKNGKNTCRVFIGDPGRHALPDKMILNQNSLKLTTIAEYPLPAYISREHYGITTAKIYGLESLT